MEFRKLLWAFRAVAYKPFFGKIGGKSYIGKPVSLIGTKNIYVGNRVRIYPGVRMEAHKGGKIVINENCSIAQNFHITAEQEELIIEKNTTILGNVFITNIDHDYRDIKKHIMDQDWKVSTTRIGEGSFIGFGAAIQAGTVLGKHCIVGTNAVVRGYFPDYCVIVGVPGRVEKKYNPVSGEWERTPGVQGDTVKHD